MAAYTAPIGVDVHTHTDEGRADLAMAALLPGEVPIFKDVECVFKFHSTRVLGTLSATTYRVVFTPGGAQTHTQTPASAAAPGAPTPLSAQPLMPAGMRHLPRSFFVLPVALIRRIEKVTPRTARDAAAPSAFALEVTSKDVRTWCVGLRDEETADRIGGRLRMVAFPSKPEYMLAFEPASLSVPKAGGTQPGWELHNPYRELERMGVLSVVHPRTKEPLWRVSDINREYAFSKTYPSVLVFPDRTTDAALGSVGGFRSKARVPAMTWVHPVNRTTMWRCSQPRVGMAGNVCREDEALLAAIRDLNVYSRDPTAPLLIADCRPRANAMAQKAGGWGYESYAFSQLEFLGIHNIHEVRDAQKRLEALALSTSPQDVNWSSSVADTKWLYHVRSVLSASIFVADCMHRRGQSVVVHCSDGWDRTAQVCGLVQIMLDPYFRTLRGLCVLIAKEWLAFGHKFHDRLGHAMEKHDDTDISPVFLQWLDALWQLVRMFPFAFEYNTQTLLMLAHHCYSCRFGTFLFNCESERAAADVTRKTSSLWAYLLSDAVAPSLLNPRYDPSIGDILLPHPAAVLRNVDVWDAWFLRWSPFPSFSSCCYRMEKYAPTAYSHDHVSTARWAPGSAKAAATGAAAVPHAAEPAPAPEPKPTVDPLAGTALEAVPVHSVPVHGGSPRSTDAEPDAKLSEPSTKGGAPADAALASEPSLHAAAEQPVISSSEVVESVEVPVDAEEHDVMYEYTAAFLTQDDGDATVDGVPEE